MKLSVIIPCYNKHKTIFEIADKVKNASIDDLKIIIVDNTSNYGIQKK